MHAIMIAVVSLWCLCCTASPGADVLDLIGRPTDLCTLQEMWPSNSVYCAYTKETILLEHGNEEVVYKRYVVDELGTNPGVLPGETCDYIRPLLQYHVRGVGTNSLSTVEAIEVYEYAEGHALIRPVCKALGVEVLPFHRAVAIAPDQMWKGIEDNYLRMDARSDKHGDMTVIYHYYETNLISITAFPKRVGIERKGNAGCKRNAMDSPCEENGVLDLQGIRLHATNLLESEADKTMCKDFHTWSDKGQKRFLQAIEKIKERSKEGAPIYAQMSRLGLAASKEVRIKKRPTSWDERVCSTADNGIQVVTLVHHASINYEVINALFIDRSILADIDEVMFPNVGKLPESVHDCRRRMKVLGEITNFAGTRSVVFGDPNLAILYEKGKLRYALYGMYYGDRRLWEMLSISGELFDIQGGHQYVRWRP